MSVCKVKRLLILVIIIWFVLSILRTVNNLTKIYREEKEWIFLSDNQKKGKIFGDVFYFLTFIQERTENDARILFILPSSSVENRLEYLGQYYLYPRKLQFVSKSKAIGVFNMQKPHYVVIYDSKKNMSTLEVYKKVLAGKYRSTNYTGSKFQGSIFYIHE